MAKIYKDKNGRYLRVIKDSENFDFFVLGDSNKGSIAIHAQLNLEGERCLNSVPAELFPFNVLKGATKMTKNKWDDKMVAFAGEDALTPIYEKLFPNPQEVEDVRTFLD